MRKTLATSSVFLYISLTRLLLSRRETDKAVALSASTWRSLDDCAALTAGLTCRYSNQHTWCWFLRVCGALVLVPGDSANVHRLL